MEDVILCCNHLQPTFVVPSESGEEGALQDHLKKKERRQNFLLEDARLPPLCGLILFSITFLIFLFGGKFHSFRQKLFSILLV